jgi:hypothetical protein
MMNITNRFRKILRTVFRGIGVSVVSLILQACYGVIYPDDDGPGGAYGMPPPAYGMPYDVSINGKVVAKETGNPIFRIQVSVEETEYSERTDPNGNFYLYVPSQKEYKLKFEDVDGPDNGGQFKRQTWTIKYEDTYRDILVGMDIDTEADEE